jgi:hypothetical protein
MTPARLREIADDADRIAATVGFVLRLQPGEASTIAGLARKNPRWPLPPMTFFCGAGTQGSDLRLLAGRLRRIAAREESEQG